MSNRLNEKYLFDKPKYIMHIIEKKKKTEESEKIHNTSNPNLNSSSEKKYSKQNLFSDSQL